MDLQLSGKVAVVTGAASGMGRAVAITLATEGAVVAAADFDAEGAATVAKELVDAGHSCHAYFVDVTRRDAWETLRGKVTESLGPVDILCNIAGPRARSGHLDTDDGEWHRQLDGHLTGVFLGCQTFLPAMIERRYGKIVNMCSFLAHGGSKGIPGYVAAFGGILAYTKSIARYAAPHNVNVNCISPGNIETPMTRDGWLDQPAERDQLRKQMPIGRIGQPEDVSSWFAFLVSDRAQHAVGVEINVSGGQLFT
jgi:NAD(P)-dependent dehydrogenase (short-subunit alcohol dehydrogenase family)